MKYKDLDKGPLDLFSEDFESEPKISEAFIQKLKSHESLEDIEFDRILPPLHRFLSPVQWTSINVAMIISDWLRHYKNKKFLDVGSGVGKLCILLRFLTELEIHGVEQRPDLVKISQQIINTNELTRISFEEGNVKNISFTDFDIFYLYNPFQEHVCASDMLTIDNKIELDKKYFREYIAKIFEELKTANTGSILITFHGYGGSIPKSWTLKYSQFVEGGFLSLWIKDSP